MLKAWFIVITLMFLAGIVLRIWRRRLAPVLLQKVALQPAMALVGEFLASCYDGQFGFPTGFFVVEQTSANRVVAREFAFRQSHFGTILRRLYRSVLSFGAAFGCMGSVIGLALAVALTPVLLYVAVTEVALRYLLRSQIEASLAPASGGTVVAFTLRGPAALLVGRRLASAFHPPSLPPRVAALAGLTAPGPS